MSAVAGAGVGAGETFEPPAEPVAGAKRRRWLPYALLAPGGLWLIIFFAIPTVQLLRVSFFDPEGSWDLGYAVRSPIWGNFIEMWDLYQGHFLRSLAYALIATLACLLLGYPLAYAIAVKAGRWKNLMLIAVIAPFFTSFLVRTMAWQTILSDHGWVVTGMKDVGLLGADGRLLATPVAVIAGLTYNFLPFMVLPLYASLEKLDTRLLEAASDLYANPIRSFAKVTLPLSMPGLVAGTLLTFIPATGDYINAELLGSTSTQMIGNVIQSKFLVTNQDPYGAALSFVLMASILVIVLVYVRKAGTEEVV